MNKVVLVFFDRLDVLLCKFLLKCRNCFWNLSFVKSYSMCKVCLPNLHYQNNKGLNDVPPGLFATAIPAERARRFESPSRKF